MWQYVATGCLDRSQNEFLGFDPARPWNHAQLVDTDIPIVLDRPSNLIGIPDAEAAFDQHVGVIRIGWKGRRERRIRLRLLDELAKASFRNRSRLSLHALSDRGHRVEVD